MPAASPIRDRSQQMLDALMAGNSSRAYAIATAAADAGLDRLQLFDEVLAPALREVGARWEGGLVSVTQEQLATSAAESVLRRLTPPAPEDPRATWLVASVEGDRHRVGLHMASAALFQAGCAARVAYAQSVEAIVSMSASVDGVCLACSGPWSVAPARAAASRVAAEGVPVLLGGGGWAGWQDPPRVHLVASMAELASRVRAKPDASAAA